LDGAGILSHFSSANHRQWRTQALQHRLHRLQRLQRRRWMRLRCQDAFAGKQLSQGV